jgi:hypothetical protein
LNFDCGGVSHSSAGTRGLQYLKQSDAKSEAMGLAVVMEAQHGTASGERKPP